MKIKTSFAFTFLLMVSITVVYSCKKKSSADTNTNATTTTTTTTTTTYTSADYAGTWTTTSMCSSSMSYTMTITTSGSGGVSLANFHANALTNGYKLNATISNKTITIPSQTVVDAYGANSLTFSGSGTLAPPSSLSISYIAKDPGSPASLSCTATCTK